MSIYYGNLGYAHARRMAQADADLYRAPQVIHSQAGAQTDSGWRYTTRALEHGELHGWSMGGGADTFYPSVLP